MEKIKFEAPGEHLLNYLKNTGLNDKQFNKFKGLINKIKFVDIDINNPENRIHVDMMAGLLSIEKYSGKIFLEKILNNINHEIQDAEWLLISSVKNFETESIDLNIGTNRCVDKIECVFSNDSAYNFTLSADLLDHEDDRDSNSFIEKEVFESPLGQNNPVMQNYFGYAEKELSGRNYRLIAKEYLPGKNISQYLNELEASEFEESLSDVSCELAYSMGYLYQRMKGQLLEDLKLENVIYNYQNPDSNKSLCRICDHSGYYDDSAEVKSVTQITGQLNSLLTMYYVKSGQRKEGSNNNNALSAEDILANYLDSFVSEIDSQNKEMFINKVKELRNMPEDKRLFESPDGLLDFIINYLESGRYPKH